MKYFIQEDFDYDPDEYFLRNFVGRKEELDWISHKIINENDRIAIISGEAGIGKTALAKMFAQRFKHEFPAGIFYIPLNPFESISNHISKNGLENASQPFLLILDEHEITLSDSVIMSEVGRILNNISARVLITSRQTIQTSFGKSLELTNFTQAEMEELILKRLHNSNLDRSTLDKFYAIFQGHPLALNIASGTLRDGIFSIQELFDSLTPFTKQGLVGPDKRPLNPESKQFKLIVNDIAAIPVMVVNAYEQRLVYMPIRKHFMILHASTRHITWQINDVRRYNFRQLG